MALPPPPPPPLPSPQLQFTAAGALAPLRPAAHLASPSSAGSTPANGAAFPGSVNPARLAAALEANNQCIAVVADHLAHYFKGSVHLVPSGVFQAFFGLARSIDYALSGNDIPAVAHHLPSLIKQVFRYRNDPLLQSAVMVVMISAKNACRNRWFPTSDTDELLNMANELFGSFCMSVKDTTYLGNGIDTISWIMPRYYPCLKFCSLIVSFEAKPGYDILLADFQISRDMPPDQKIMLLVVQTDNLETSACIINPPQVSFLVNGKGVDKRTNFLMDTGPQFPTDITKMLKFGTNIIQAIGYFSGNCLITVASMSKITSPHLGKLEDYVHSLVAEDASGSDIIEGPSRITLNCPISFKRIKIPVKGHLCKHHQCFDYENFIEMNLRKPSWRCPCCNTPVSYIDLRIDQNMAKILREVGQDVLHVVVFVDGSWKNVAEHNGTINQLHKETDGHLDSSMESENSALAGVMDLTTEENSNAPNILEEMLPLHESSSGGDNVNCETADRKPFSGKQSFPITEAESVAFSAFENTQTTTYHRGDHLRVSSYSISKSLPITFGLNAIRTSDTSVPLVLNSIQTDAVTPAHSRDILPASSFQNATQARQNAENMQLNPSYNPGSVISNEIGRNPIARHVTTNPIAIQALPAQTQLPITYRRMKTSWLSSPVNINKGYSAPYQTLTPASLSSGFNSVTCDEIEQQSRTPELASASLQRHSVSQVIGLPAPNLIATLAPQEQLRGSGAYRVPFQSLAEKQNTHQVLNQNRLKSTTSNPLPSRVPSTPMQQVSQNSASPASIGSSHNVLLASERPAQAAMMRAGAARYLSESRVTSVPAVPDTNGPLLSATSNGLPELPPEHNWQPTGRMRGSLTGSAYSAALNQYLDPPTQPTQSHRSTS